MTKGEILEFIKLNIDGNKETVKRVFEYISCETEEEPKDLTSLNICVNNDNFHNNFPYAHFFEIEENQEIEKRFLKIFSRADSEKFIEIVIKDNIRYYCYYTSNINRNIISREITYNLYDILKYMRNHIIDNRILEHLKNLILLPSEYYEDVLFRDAFKFDKYESTRQISSIIIMAQKIQLHEKKYERFIPDLERIVYSLIKCVYSDDEVNSVFDKYIKNEEIKNYYMTFEPVNIVFKDLEYLIVLYLVSYMCSDISILIHNAFKICFIMWGFAVNRAGSGKPLKEIYQKYSIPDEIIVKNSLIELYHYINSDYGNIIEHIKEMNDFVIQYPDICMNMLLYCDKNKFDIDIYTENSYDCKQKFSSYIPPMLGLLLKHDKIKENKDTWIEGAEEIFVIELFGKDNYDKTIQILRKEQMSDNDIKSLCFCHDYYDIRRFLRLSIFMLDYSIVSKNILEFALIKDKNLYNVDLFNIYRCFKYDNNLNLYDSLYNHIKIPFNSIVELYILSSWSYENNIDEFLQFLKAHKDMAEMVIEELSGYNSIQYIKILYNANNGFNIKYVVKALYRKDKQLVEYSKEIIKSNEKEARPYIEKCLTDKIKRVKDIAFCILRYWDNQNANNDLNKIKNIDDMITYIEKFYDKANDKNIPYEKEADYENIRQLNSDKKLPIILTKFYVSEYIMQKDLYVSKICEKIKSFVNKNDFKNFINSIYNFWITDNYRPKYKNIMIPYTLMLDDYELLEFRNQIQYWSKNKKISLAAFAVKPLSMNESRQALFLINLIAKSFGKVRIREAAVNVIGGILNKLDITLDEFEDLVVPTLGFNKFGEKEFNYGNRKFKGILNKDLKIIYYDWDNNEIKSLPRYSLRKFDDESLVNKCKNDLKYIRKQIRIIINNQKVRIFQAVVSQRKWKIKNWKQIFIDNPIMTYFAINLIWEELDKNGKSIGTFKYMEDRTFNSIDEEEYILSNNTYIRLFNVVNFDDIYIHKWKQQLEDYEVIQPIEQLNMPVYYLNDENKLEDCIDIFKNNKIYFQTIKSIFNKLGMIIEGIRYGEVEECCSYIFNYSETSIKIFIDISADNYSLDYNTVCSIFKIRFKTGEGNQEKIIPVGEVPPRLLSLCMYIGNKASEKKINEQM